ncbi:MAG: alpha/beta hydrolase, partial [Devosia nanyangense]|nr:alpha/beta hydrolase [Devosia nanyangense]
VLVGDQDTVTPPECAREIHEAIAGSRFVVIENCGHCAPLEYPELVNALLEDWWSRGYQSDLRSSAAGA